MTPGETAFVTIIISVLWFCVVLYLAHEALGA
jgi:hypothetical protein